MVPVYVPRSINPFNTETVTSLLLVPLVPLKGLVLIHNLLFVIVHSRVPSPLLRIERVLGSGLGLKMPKSHSKFKLKGLTERSGVPSTQAPFSHT